MSLAGAALPRQLQAQPLPPSEQQRGRHSADRRPTQRPPNAWLQHTALSSSAPQTRKPLQSAPEANSSLLDQKLQGERAAFWPPSGSP